MATPLSAVLTYTYMSWYYLWENLDKIGSSKDFLMNFFLFAFCFAKEPSGKQTEHIATIFHAKNDTPFRLKKGKTPKAQHTGFVLRFYCQQSRGLLNTDFATTYIPDYQIHTDSYRSPTRAVIPVMHHCLRLSTFPSRQHTNYGPHCSVIVKGAF